MAVYEGKDGFSLVFQPRIGHWFDVNYFNWYSLRKIQGNVPRRGLQGS